MATISHQRNPLRARLPPGTAVRPLRLPYHLAYAASTASETPSEPDISALLQQSPVTDLTDSSGCAILQAYAPGPPLPSVRARG